MSAAAVRSRPSPRGYWNSRPVSQVPFAPESAGRRALAAGDELSLSFSLGRATANQVVGLMQGREFLI
jgi:hypothetical protein